MNTNDHGRKEPSLADLEAFEKLLRESISGEAAPAPVVPVQPATAPALSAARPSSAPMSSSDHDAMAELTRLIEQPLDFALPPLSGSRPAPVAPTPAPLPETHGHFEASFGADWPQETQVEATAALAPLPFEPAPEARAPHPFDLQTFEPQALQPHVPAQPSAQDPLAAFEEELRRFDASARANVPDVAPAAAGYAEAPPAFAEPAFAQPPAPPIHPDLAAIVERQRHESLAFDPPAAPEPQPIYVPEPPAPSPLEAAEQRLAAEAAAASYGNSEPPLSDVKRSKGVFMALGGVAVAGLAVIGGMFAFSGPKKGGPNGEIPVIAAKTQPTKEKPADPGGVEIPNQDAQVLSGRNAVKETKPAQVVNTTEQPLDLKEVTRRDSVRVVAPNPYAQTTPTPTAESAQAGVRPAEVEPRRVTSVRVPVSGEAQNAAPAASGPGASTIAAGAAGAAAIAAISAGAAPRASTPAPKPPEAAKPEAPKSEARPPKKAETPKVANAPSTPKAKAPEKITQEKNTGLRTGNAPMPLTDNKAKANAAASGGSGFAVQLASRPTEADARSAAGSLGSKYSAQLGGKGARVVSGEANGQKVYRVRAGGFSQQGATDACNKIKAAGGNCFITRQ